jgi:D-serine deaminase-like pyridoxal phosphate-dependent protein
MKPVPGDHFAPVWAAAGPDVVQRELPVALSGNVELPIDVGDDQLDTPAILVDLDVVDANIARFAGFATRSGLELRPHGKTHKSVAMANRQVDAGSVGITASGTAEARAFVVGGVRDVLLAYPLVGRRKLDRAAPLFAEAGDWAAEVTLVSDSLEVTAGYRELARSTGRRIPVLVEVDTGMHRVGADPSVVVKLAADIARDPLLKFRGVMTHAGHSHDATDELGIEAVARQEAALMGAVREDLEAAGLEVPTVSAGSTITAPYLSAADGITEIRPGTYIYNDLRTLGRWACTHDAIAATMLATVVSTEGSRLTIDAGSKTLTSSRDTTYGHGHLRSRPRTTFRRLSEEHGVLHAEDDLPMPVVGEKVEVLPIHVCVWMDLQAEVYGVRAGRIVERITVDAMRHSL